MQYLMSVIDDTTGSATPAEMTKIDAFNERIETAARRTHLRPTA